VRAADFSTDDIYLRDENRDINIACTLDPPLEFVKFKSSDPVAIHSLSFKYTRYKIGPNKGDPRLEQQPLIGVPASCVFFSFSRGRPMNAHAEHYKQNADHITRSRQLRQHQRTERSVTHS
jgi:hypothetical protein